MNKISVIVPIFNVEQLLDKCITSIANQTYRNLEIILVDDGSLDNCPQICDEWAKKDPRIVVIHKKNGGLSDARNEGVQVATGDYVGFVDSDDYIAPTMYEVLLKTLLNADADISICGFFYINEDGSTTRISQPKAEVLSPAEAFYYLSTYQNICYITAWNKLYKKKIAKKISFPVGKIHEDEFTVHRFYGECKKIACCEQLLYYYVQRSDSIMHKPFSEKNMDAVGAYLDRYYYFDSLSLKHEKKFALRQAYGRLILGIKVLPSISSPVIKPHLKTIVRLMLKECDPRVIKLLITYCTNLHKKDKPLSSE